MINWLIQSQADITAQLPQWLSAAELAEYSALRVAPRRQAWLVGRWTAKRLIQAARSEAGQWPLSAIQLSPACGRTPHASWPGSLGAWPLSLSHTGQQAVAALADTAEVPLGIDLECVEARSPDFARQYFTPRELDGLAGAPDQVMEQVTALWCAKEAVLKALGVGLTLDTRSVSLWLDRGPSDRPGWRRLEVAVDAARLPAELAGAAKSLHGWWRRHGPYTLAIVTNTSHHGAAGWPIEMQPAPYLERLV